LQKKEMDQNNSYHYDTIAKALDFIQQNFKAQPSLDEIAASVHLSSFHFQRLFTDFVGTSPKNFLQYTTLNYAKSLLNKQQTLFDTTFQSGLSSTSRLHDLFIKIEGMSPAEYQNGGKNLAIDYSFARTSFGDIIVASTSKGICHLMFYNSPEEGLSYLKNQFPNAVFTEGSNPQHAKALQLFQQNPTSKDELKLHLKGTEFQLKVWSALLKIPFAELSTYGDLAKNILQPNASRAVGTAIGSNPVAFLIPCHRVIRKSGELGGYMWGETRKRVILAYEQCTTTPGK
jgi:AraC family transcriptional regulator of adaptative response/methylated-DNA-[protein]-cysteine methyltransferase